MESLQVYAEGFRFLINANVFLGIFPFQPDFTLWKTPLVL